MHEVKRSDFPRLNLRGCFLDVIKEAVPLLKALNKCSLVESVLIKPWQHHTEDGPVSINAGNHQNGVSVLILGREFRRQGFIIRTDYGAEVKELVEALESKMKRKTRQKFRPEPEHQAQVIQFPVHERF